MSNNNILVTGGNGTLGKAIQQIMPDAFYPSRKNYNLTNPMDIMRIMGMMYNAGIQPPQVVVHAAARVGGIMDNIEHPADYFYDNVLMDTLMVKYALQAKIERFTAILSTCAYPDVASSYPLTEDMLHDGPPAATNFSYGYAKRAMAVHIDAANKQYGTRYNYLIPCNLYSGKNLNDYRKGHFLDTLLSKIKGAKQPGGLNRIFLMGTGVAKRQFMTAGDLARVIKLTVEQGVTESFNVCPDENLSIRELTEVALRACDATDIAVEWDSSMPDGQLNKQASNEKFKSLFPDFKFTPLEEGIAQAYQKLF